MTPIKRTLFVAILALAAACGGKKKDSDKVEPPPATKPVAGTGGTMAGSAAATPTMAGSAAATPTMAGSAAMAGSAVELPATADYEDKAKTEITDKNASSQLDDLEKDLGQ